MTRTIRIAAAAVLVVGGLAVGAPASAAPPEAVSTFTYTQNMHSKGFSARENTENPFTANSDIAFWGDLVVEANYDGFRLVDLSAPAVAGARTLDHLNPQTIGFTLD